MHSFKVTAMLIMGAMLLMTLVTSGLSRAAPQHDLEPAASGHDGGRVQIKVYRGPTEHDGHDHFAPWGYWVKQPADDGHH